MSEFDSKRFKALQKRWYAKLAKAGFVDQEREDGTLIDEDREYRAKQTATEVRQARAEYYRNAEHYMTRAGRMPKRDRQIWALHVEGISNREIEATLGLSRTVVVQTIERHRGYMLNASRLANTSDT